MRYEAPPLPVNLNVAPSKAGGRARPFAENGCESDDPTFDRRKKGDPGVSPDASDENVMAIARLFETKKAK